MAKSKKEANKSTSNASDKKNKTKATDKENLAVVTPRNKFNPQKQADCSSDSSDRDFDEASETFLSDSEYSDYDSHSEEEVDPKVLELRNKARKAEKIEEDIEDDLWYAVKEGKDKAVKTYLDSGHGLDARKNVKTEYIDLAIKYEDISLLELFDVKSKDSILNVKLLQQAAKEGRVRVVEFLIDDKQIKPNKDQLNSLLVKIRKSIGEIQRDLFEGVPCEEKLGDYQDVQSKLQELLPRKTVDKKESEKRTSAPQSKKTNPAPKTPTPTSNDQSSDYSYSDSEYSYGDESFSGLNTSPSSPVRSYSPNSSRGEATPVGSEFSSKRSAFTPVSRAPSAYTGSLHKPTPVRRCDSEPMHRSSFSPFSSVRANTVCSYHRFDPNHSSFIKV